MNSHITPTIVIFDSGVGGLSIYRKIKNLLPNLHYIYVFDNKGFPYGEKNEKFILNNVFTIIKTISKKMIISLVVIACNSASVISLRMLRNNFSFPIVGVVPAIKPAVHLTRNGIVGLLATHATIHHEYTDNLINNFSGNIKIKKLSAGKLVDLAEAKLRGDNIVIVDEIEKILKPWLKMDRPPDTIVLGCTHFPLLKDELKVVLPNKTLLVDSGAAIAYRTMQLLKDTKKTINSDKKNIAFCTVMNTNAIVLWPYLKLNGFQFFEKLDL